MTLTQFDSEMENPPEDIQESESTDDSVTANCNSYSYDERKRNL